MSTTTTIAGIVTGGVVVGALGYYLIKQGVNAPPGGACNVAGTPCYTATEPYKKAWQMCYTNNRIVSAEIAKQGYATPAQSSLQAEYTQCENYNAGMMASLAVKFEPVNPANAFVAMLYPLASEGILVAGGVSALRVFAGYVLKSKSTMFYSQTATDSAGDQATLQGQADSGQMTGAEASQAEQTMQSNVGDIAAAQAAAEAEIEETAAVFDLTSEEASLAVTLTEDAVVSDVAMEETIDVLALAAA